MTRITRTPLCFRFFTRLLGWFDLFELFGNQIVDSDLPIALVWWCVRCRFELLSAKHSLLSCLSRIDWSAMFSCTIMLKQRWVCCSHCHPCGNCLQTPGVGGVRPPFGTTEPKVVSALPTCKFTSSEVTGFFQNFHGIFSEKTF